MNYKDTYQFNVPLNLIDFMQVQQINVQNVDIYNQLKKIFY